MNFVIFLRHIQTIFLKTQSCFSSGRILSTANELYVLISLKASSTAFKERSGFVLQVVKHGLSFRENGSKNRCILPTPIAKRVSILSVTTESCPGTQKMLSDLRKRSFLVIPLIFVRCWTVQRKQKKTVAGPTPTNLIFKSPFMRCRMAKRPELPPCR